MDSVSVMIRSVRVDFDSDCTLTDLGVCSFTSSRVESWDGLQPVEYCYSVEFSYVKTYGVLPPIIYGKTGGVLPPVHYMYGFALIYHFTGGSNIDYKTNKICLGED